MWPLIERELRMAMRQNASGRRWKFALIAGGVSAFLLPLGHTAKLGGQNLFGILLLLGVYIAVLPVLRISTDCFSLERRSGNLGLLFLTGLRPLEIFVSKLSGVFIASLYYLIGLAPFLALPFLSGGISKECFLATIVVLPNLLLFTLSVSVISSVVCRDEGAAFGLALMVGGFICLFTPAIWYVFNYLSAGSISNAILYFSPAYAVMVIKSSLPPSQIIDFWRTSGITFGCSIALMITAALVLKKTWQDQSATLPQARVVRWFMGSTDLEARAQVRNEWLDRNPFAWLVLRDRLTVRVTAGLLMLCAAVWAALAIAWPLRFATPLNAIVAAIVAIWIVTSSIGVAAARRFSEDRRSGAFELLLTTPLNEVEIMGGYQTALRDLFRPLYVALLIGEGVLAVVPLLTHRWNNWMAFVSYSMIWLLLFVYSMRSQFSTVPQTMWVSLNSGRTIYSVWRSFNLGGWGSFWIVYYIVNSRSGLSRFPTGGVGELVFVIVIAVVSWAVVSERSGNERAKYQWLLTQYFRGLSTSPLPSASDPQWKKWDMKSPFPGYGFIPPAMAMTTTVTNGAS